MNRRARRAAFLSAAACSLALLLGSSPRAHAEGFYGGIEGGATFSMMTTRE